MQKITLITLLLLTSLGWSQDNQYATSQGSVSFFSYTPVENIKASNDLVYSLLDLDKNQIAVRMLMRAFTFEKALMQQHFNESYIESDIYPKATFAGVLENFDAAVAQQTCLISGTFSLHGESQQIQFKSTVNKQGNSYVFSGDFQLQVADYNIKIPVLLRPNIAKTVSVTFNFEFLPYEAE